MARHFDGGASTDKLTISSVTKWDDLRDGPFTITMWFKPEDNGSNEGYMLGKRNSGGDSAPKITAFKSGGQLRVDLDTERDTESALARSLNVFTFDTWQFLAVAHTFDEATDNPTQFRGVPGGAVTQVSYNTQRAGSGNRINNVAANLVIGNVDQDDRAFLGDIAELRIYDVDIPRDLGGPTTAATLGALTSIMYGRYHPGTANSLIGYLPLIGANTADMSGHQPGPENVSTIVGTDVVDGPPTGPFWGYDRVAISLAEAAAIKRIQDIIMGAGVLPFPR